MRKRLLKFVTPGLFSIGLLLFGCRTETEDLPLEDIQIDFEIVRMDLDMLDAARSFQSKPGTDSSKIFEEFFKDDREFLIDWFFYGNDSVGTDSAITVILNEFLSDPNALLVLETVNERFPREAPEEQEQWKLEIENFFKRFYHHFPNRKIPKVVTFADGYPRTIQQGLERVIITPEHLGIGLHYVLGEGYQYYPPDLPRYLSRRFTREHLPATIAHQYADLMIPEPGIETNPVLIDQIVHQGLQLYFVDQLLGPGTQDSVKLFYNTEQIEWATTYEARAYKDIVPVLYDVNAELIRRYIDDSPFTSQLNRKSAPRLGQFLGWKIIQAFVAKYPETQLKDLIARTDYQQIFKESAYRPSNQ